MECKILPIPINYSYYQDLTIAPRVKGISVLARRLTAILPAMTLPEAIETTRIHRVAGLTGRCIALTVANLGRDARGPTTAADLNGGVL